MAMRKQVAALPVKMGEDGSIRVMLVTSRETRRLVIPKGWPWRGLKNHKAAAEEAREEAGILGKARKRSIGTYIYQKRLPDRSVDIKVKVYLLEVERELDRWPEQSQRERMWCTLRHAAACVAEPGLSALILGLQASLQADPEHVAAAA